MRRPINAIFVTALIALAGACSAITLKPGDPAPPMKVGRWVRAPGKPTAPKKIGVVAFFSSGSAPCKQTYPIVLNVARAHAARVQVQAVAVYEKTSGPQDTSHYATVAAFVKQMGPQMPYPVGVDGPGLTMTKTWLEASGQRGVPVAYVVGRDGKILWIGHTMMLQHIMGEILSGKFDAKAFRAQYIAEIEQEECEYRLFKKFNELSEAGRHREAVAELDRIGKAQPEYGRRMVLVRFSLLLKFDEPAAYAFGRELLNGELKEQSGLLWLMARSLLDETPGLKSPDYRLAFDLAQRSADLTKHQDANILTALAFAHFKLGRVDKAIEIQKAAIPIGDANPDIPARNKELMRKRLEMFTKAKSG
ncbi:MAG: TlpA family protein disulfide reductase [Armatimonadetes bacterium]|nr:TlpA family protein disulfide reductase [Armatimonadota bacterium]